MSSLLPPSRILCVPDDSNSSWIRLFQPLIDGVQAMHQRCIASVRAIMVVPSAPGVVTELHHFVPLTLRREGGREKGGTARHLAQLASPLSLTAAGN